MDQFRQRPLDGVWWLPEASENTFNGQLTINESNDGLLTLYGSEELLAALPTSAVRPTFFGKIYSQYPYAVTLFDVVLQRGPTNTYPKGPDKSTNADFITNAIVIGGHVASQDLVSFNGAIVKLTGLDTWCDLTGFSGHLENPTPAQHPSRRLTVTFDEGATPYYDVGSGRTLRFLSQYFGPWSIERSKHVVLEESNFLESRLSERTLD